MPEPRVGKIEDLTHDGRGVTRHEGKTVFVHDALPGEEVRYQVKKRRRSYDEAALLELLSQSSDRIEPKCEAFGLCGGCSMQHMDADKQLESKRKHLQENFARIGGVQPENELEPLSGPRWGYRRRARLGVKWVEKKERVLVGFRERGQPYIADMKACEILDPRVGQKLPELAKLIEGMDGRARMPQIEVACGDEHVVLVVRHLDPLSDKDTQAWREYGEQSGFWIYLQPGGLDSLVPLADDTPVLQYALPEYDVTLDFLPIDFVQINAELNRKMIQHALGLLNLEQGDRVLELFAGLGNFTLPLAREGADVVAVEGDHGLVERGRANALKNGLDAEYHVADLFQPQDDAPWMRSGYNKVLLDPPRAGAEEILPAVLKLKPSRIVYVSCHPASLARDAKIICDAGYVCTDAGVMDMFPHTGHVESIAAFSLK